MIPQKLGRFEIISYLGGGRFGDVYLARDTIIKEDLALKVARSRVTDTSSFLQEIKVLFSLHHPNILRYYSADIIDSKLVLVTEYVQGQTLRNYIEKRCPTTLLVVEQILRPIAEAIDYAHSQLIIHRDLKPENIMLTKEKSVKLMDFGLSKFLDRDLSQSIGGTPPYMSPESWRGKIHKASDQWSLAVIAVELLTGTNPFFAENLEDMREKILQSQNPRSFFLSRIPPATEEAFRKAFSENPEFRFDTCKEFVEKAFRHMGITRKTRKKKSKKADQNPVILPQIAASDLRPSGPFHLTQEQKNAVDAKQKRILAIGGPGTGKTYTLVAKVYELVVQKTANPLNILIISFTVRSWQDVEKRIQKALKTKAKDIWIGNFHRHCYSILSLHAERLGYQEGFEVISPAVSLQILKELETETDFDGYLPPTELRAMISRLKQKGVTSKHFRPSTQHEAYLKHMWQKYQELLRTKNRMDTNDVPLKTLKILKENPNILRGYQNLFNYILIDDLQDFVSNELYVEILHCLLGKENHLFCTGDDDQNIYGWKNNNGQAETRIDKCFSDLAVYNLTKSFRIPQEIRSPALNLIGHNENRLEKVLWTQKKPKEGLFEIKSFPTPIDEAVFAAHTIKNAVAFEKCKWKDFAVLCRSRRHQKPYKEVFVKMSIPFSLVDTESFFEKADIVLLIRYLRLISDLKAKEDIEYVIARSALTREETAKFLEKIHTRKSHITSLAALKLAIETLDFCQDNGHWGKGKPLSMDEDVATFLEIVEDFESISSEKNPETFLRYLRIYKDSGLKQEEEAVKLLTIHQAKGLEFPVVFVGGLIEGDFPRISPLGAEASLSEERRVCYVGMTRALQKLYLTYSTYRNLNKSHLNRPSRFLKEMIGV